jgi:hypothetical protein
VAENSVLAIGIEPAFADFTAFPELTPELIRDYINRQIEQLRTFGYNPVSCFVDLGDTAEETVTRALESRRFDCILIGAGLRQPPERLLLFEKIINLCHQLAPDARICFNTTPADTAAAVRRWLEPQAGRGPEPGLP